jgi:hypothetical protein
MAAKRGLNHQLLPAALKAVVENGSILETLHRQGCNRDASNEHWN